MSAAFNAEVWLVERQIEAGRADHVAIRGSRDLTYAGLAELASHVAAGLRSLGLRRDDRVVMVTNDDVAMVGAILGAFRAGIVAVPVSTMLGGAELGEIIADSGAQVLVASAAYQAQIEQAIALSPELRHVVTDGDFSPDVPDGVSVSSFSDLVTSGERADAELRSVAPTTDDSWALWLYTSGTTGSPKGAMHRHANIRHVCQTYGEQVLGITPDDVCLSVAKLFFAYGIGNSLFFPLSVGATTLLEPGWESWRAESCRSPRAPWSGSQSLGYSPARVRCLRRPTPSRRGWRSARTCSTSAIR